jgi:hypothetical protein
VTWSSISQDPEEVCKASDRCRMTGPQEDAGAELCGNMLTCFLRKLLSHRHATSPACVRISPIRDVRMEEEIGRHRDPILSRRSLRLRFRPDRFGTKAQELCWIIRSCSFRRSRDSGAHYFQGRQDVCGHGSAIDDCGRSSSARLLRISNFSLETHALSHARSNSVCRRDLVWSYVCDLGRTAEIRRPWESNFISLRSRPQNGGST